MGFLKNKNLVMLVIIVALGLIAWGFMRQNAQKEEIAFPKLQFDDPSKIVINQKEGPTVLIKEGNQWLLEEGVAKFPADPLPVDQLLSVLKDFPWQEMVSQNESKYPDFQLTDAEATRVQWFKGTASQGELFLGRSDWQRQGDYVRVPGSKAVYITKGNIISSFIGQSFKDLSFFKTDPEKITRLSWNYPAEKELFSLIKKTVKAPAATTEDKNQAPPADKTKWFFEGKGGEADLAQEVPAETIQGLLGQIALITAKDALPKAATKTYGFDAFFYQLTVEMDKENQVLTFGAQADESPAYYGENQSKPGWVYLIDIPLVKDQLAKKKKDFLTPPATAPTPALPTPPLQK